MTTGTEPTLKEPFTDALSRATGGAFGGSSRYPTKGRARPAGSKLARKAAEGKL